MTKVAPLSDEVLETIRSRAKIAAQARKETGRGDAGDHDVPVLLAEIDRLRAAAHSATWEQLGKAARSAGPWVKPENHYLERRNPMGDPVAFVGVEGLPKKLGWHYAYVTIRTSTGVTQIESHHTTVEKAKLWCDDALLTHYFRLYNAKDV